jgi:hypothetical protein
MPRSTTMISIDHLEQASLPKSNPLTIGEVYGPAMNVTTKEDADLYFNALVKYTMKRFKMSKQEAQKTTKANLGYYAGHCIDETMHRVQKLFSCFHQK